ncbi:MAG TPA: L-histidine N(alpha)-methyltransferase [Candidatus Saccharimonadales bacterium]|jgi:uncharacterized SAM-dependent methyltransferase
MLYFSNQELANTHHVSVRTVRNWIESAKSGKLDITLHTKGERVYIANTSKNIAVVQGLAKTGKKFRPHRSQKTVTPKSEFYELYTQGQLYDIVSDLEINHEIPRKYNYFGKGADNWNNYAKRLSQEDTPNTLKASIELLQNNQEYLDYLLEQYDQINVIDVGVGNSLPVREFLGRLLEKKKIGRYIGLDISPTMLKIAESNIQSWFGGDIIFEGHEVDIDHERFGNLLAEEYIKTDSSRTTNLIMFLGGTIANFRKPETVLQVIHDSMGVNDFFIHSQKLDTLSSRRYFDFNPTPSTSQLAPLHQYIFDLLNIDDSLYEVDMGLDKTHHERYIRVILKVGLDIRFRFQGGERVISFDKNDKILLWRARQNNVTGVVNQLTENEFYPIHISQTSNQEFVLTVSRIRRD